MLSSSFFWHFFLFLGQTCPLCWTDGPSRHLFSDLVTKSVGIFVAGHAPDFLMTPISSDSAADETH
jgi:hypothetical protein